MKKSFLVYHDQREVFKELNNEELGELFRAMCDYSATKETKKLPKDLRFLFLSFKTQIDRNETKYKETCEQNSKNAKKRWNKKHATASNRMRTNAKHADKDKDKDKDITKNNYVNEINEYLFVYNKLFNTNKTSHHAIKKNFGFWRKEYTLEQIKQAIKNVKNGFWADKPSPELIFRTKNKSGDCDYIGELLDLKEKTMDEKLAEAGYEV